MNSNVGHLNEDSAIAQFPQSIGTLGAEGEQHDSQGLLSPGPTPPTVQIHSRRFNEMARSTKTCSPVPFHFRGKLCRQAGFASLRTLAVMKRATWLSV